MPDITICLNHECLRCLPCYRYTAQAGELQSVAEFEGGADCQFFLDKERWSR